MTAAELDRLAQEIGIDVIGAAPVAAYEETERHIAERRARGLFADMRFTMAQPEVSCHPETLLAGARTVVSAALCIDACPTDALDEPGTLDATRCLSYWTQSSDPIPEAYREPLEDRVYGCDICQDVCPWNRGIEKRRAHEAPPDGAEPHVSLLEWLEASDDELRRRYDRLFVPKNDPKYLRRNALVALGNVGGAAEAAVAARYADGDDPLLREHAEWARARIRARTGAYEEE